MHFSIQETYDQILNSLRPVLAQCLREDKVNYLIEDSRFEYVLRGAAMLLASYEIGNQLENLEIDMVEMFADFHPKRTLLYPKTPEHHRGFISRLRGVLVRDEFYDVE